MSIAYIIRFLQQRHRALFFVLFDVMTLLGGGYRLLPITRGFYLASCMRSVYERIMIGFCAVAWTFCETGTLTYELSGLVLSALLLRSLQLCVVNTRFARRVVVAFVLCALQLYLWFASDLMLISWWYSARAIAMLCVVISDVE